MYYEVGPNPNQIQHGAFAKRAHKYIAKIGEGVKARYFYTQEELNAYKKAFSSKDEKAAYENAQRTERTALNNLSIAKSNHNKSNDTYKKASSKQAELYKSKKSANSSMYDSMNKYTKSRTVKGKIDDLRSGKGFMKSISSKDDEMNMKRESRAAAKANKLYSDASDKRTRAEYDRNKSKDNLDKAQKDYEKAETNRVNTKSDYERVQTTSGKISDAKKVFDKYHPETSKRISRGKKKIESMISNVNDYKNALSSKDEEKKYKQSVQKTKEIEKYEKDFLKGKTDVDPNSLDGFVGKAVLKDTINEAKNKENKAGKDYQREKTIKCKAEDVRDIYSQHNKKRKK